ncbi:MAG TPA: hypothetical protein PLB96_11500 [Syntrophales bacterium]|nr:hypothetical protein [Syntrophales bacterium]
MKVLLGEAAYTNGDICHAWLNTGQDRECQKKTSVIFRPENGLFVIAGYFVLQKGVFLV